MEAVALCTCRIVTALFVALLHIVQGPVLFCSLASVIVCRRCLSESVTLHGGPAGGFTRAGQAMTSCRL